MCSGNAKFNVDLKFTPKASITILTADVHPHVMEISSLYIGYGKKRCMSIQNVISQKKVINWWQYLGLLDTCQSCVLYHRDLAANSVARTLWHCRAGRSGNAPMPGV